MSNTFGEIVILGASYSGMLLAISLAKDNISSVILEKSSEITFNDPRTISITQFSKKYFQEIGIWVEVKKEVTCVDEIFVLNNKNSNIIKFSKDNLSKEGFHYLDNDILAQGDEEDLTLGYMIPANKLKKIFYTFVKESALINLITGVGYQDIISHTDKTEIILDKKLDKLNKEEKKTTTNITIACDGKNSRARQKYFPYLINHHYKQTALIFDVRHEKENRNQAVEWFMPLGQSSVFAVLPLQDKNVSSVVWSLKSELAYKYINSTEVFNIKLQEIFSQFLGNILSNTPVQSFNLSAQIVKCYYSNKLLLLGDAAHSIHPLAGQGFNQTIKDIASLSKIILRYYDLGIEPDISAMKKYSRERYFDNFKMYVATDFIDKVFSVKNPFIEAIRDVGFNLTHSSTWLQDKIIRYGIGG